MKTLETPRLLLRPWAWGDLYDFYEYASNPRIGPRPDGRRTAHSRIPAQL